MQTHEDADFGSRKPKVPFDFARLEQRAREMIDKQQSRITAGKPDEPVLDEWDDEGIHCTQRPEDEQGILRISIGGGVDGVGINYCVFRGSRRQCADLLERALKALRERYILKGPHCE